ncbi:MAG TPA: LemA family protein [Candidatus Obscuribacterales bacterium]
MYILIGFLVALVVTIIWVIGTYNRLVLLRQNVRESWSAIETELRRRYDLIPNLVETVKGYASHEKDTLEAVIQARNSAASISGSPDAQAQAQNILTGALHKLIALSEAYPQLKANENFASLQREIGETETRISQARRFYNANVREMNTAVETFPSVLLAGPMGFKPQVYFGIEDPQAFEPVKVSFQKQSEVAPGGTISLKTSIEDKQRS